MFKAPLIESLTYYQLRRRQLIISLLALIPMGLLMELFEWPVWLGILLGIVYLLAIILMFKDQKRIKEASEKNIIEIGADFITIQSKNSDHKTRINLDNVDEIIVKKEYGLPEESLKDIAGELTGKHKKNFITLKQEDQKHTFEFAQWRDKEYSIKNI